MASTLFCNDTAGLQPVAHPDGRLPVRRAAGQVGGRGAGAPLQDAGAQHQAQALRAAESAAGRCSPSPATLQRDRGQTAGLADELARLRTGNGATPDYVPIASSADALHKFLTVNLLQRDGGFGFRLVGGAEMGVPLQVGTVVRGGAAAQDGRLREGDEICEIDGHNVVGFQHDVVVSMIKQSARHGHVKIMVRRSGRPDGRGAAERGLDDFGTLGSVRHGFGGHLRDVVLQKAEHEDFGCTIISNGHRFIGKVLPNSPAARCGQLCPGDCVAAVNGFPTDEMSHADVISYIKSCPNTVVLTIDRSQQMSLWSAEGAPPGLGHSLYSANGHAAEPTNGRAESPAREPEPELVSVELQKGPKGFGFSIRGGAEFDSMPLFILKVAEDGPAAREGSLRVGDQLVNINGHSTAGMSHSEAISLIRQGVSVHLTVTRSP